MKNFPLSSHDLLLLLNANLHLNLQSLLGSRLGNSGNQKELRVLTLLHYVP
ncbi:hypothetical protein DAPPUDRAFT_321879 [Daphnia pulex]|uniref:Uncharacterized protein n=1 Tax=Daphnia pulex TaxID=6669 RepID=E9GU65_DAPPU|nr:hypothetical protein DAPPUDRAFT_321879 [Daphnia pulex]|eukprot:EFX77027.1 hypothetical protein DAPPUDRAFT_321879 [Daphnia pulex]